MLQGCHTAFVGVFAMSKSIERLENLNRVMRHVDPTELDMSNWCGCAIGHARSDPYFVKHFNPEFGRCLGTAPMSFLAEYFGIEREQVGELFLSSGYIGLGRAAAPSDVVAKLEVILMAKRANEPAASTKGRALEVVEG
jgi:hypothetical protein